MSKVYDVYDFLDGLFSFDEQESWDNSGLLVGDTNQEVKKTAVVLDVNKDTVKQAIENEVDLIVSHHPVIFKPKKNFTADSLEYALATNAISVISCHTCFDSAEGGVNDVLCSLLLLRNVYKLQTEETKRPLIRAGNIDETTGEELAKTVSETLGTRVAIADSGKKIKTVAVCTGAGGDFVAELAGKNIDAYITGEASYHEMCDGAESGLTVISAGHFETEKPAMYSLSNRLKEQFKDIEFVQLDEHCPLKYC